MKNLFQLKQNIKLNVPLLLKKAYTNSETCLAVWTSQYDG